MLLISINYYLVIVVKNFGCQIYLTFRRTVLFEVVQLVQAPKMQQYRYSQIDSITLLLSHWYYQNAIINLTAVNVHFYYKMHIEKHSLQQYGDRFTFTICSHFHRTGIVVPHNSHATKSTPIPPKIPKNHSTHFFGQTLTIPCPNSHLKSP